jgi:amidase
MRIAVSSKSPSPLGRPDDHQREALTRVAAELRNLGHEVVDEDPPYPSTLLNRWSRRWWVGIARDARHLGVATADLERRTRTMVRKGRRIDRLGGPRPCVAQAWSARVGTWFCDVDAVVLPTVATTPIAAGAYDGAGYLRTFLMAARTTPYCQAWNLSGTPALSIPAGLRNGLPLAVQIAGPSGSEGRLLGLATQLESSPSAEHGH